MAGKVPSAGDWYAVPLDDGDFGVGVIARAPEITDFVLGYFFNLRQPTVEGFLGDELERLRPEDALLFCKVSRAAVTGRKKWLRVHRSADFDLAAWGIPVVAMRPKGENPTLVFYDDTLSMGRAREQMVSPHEAEGLPDDSFATSGWVEARLTDLLAGSQTRRRLLFAPASQTPDAVGSELTPTPSEQAVIVTLPAYADDESGGSELGERIGDAIESAGVGEYDGDEYGADEMSLYFYGPDAEQLWAVIEAALTSERVQRYRAVIRRGEPGSPQRTVTR